MRSAILLSFLLICRCGLSQTTSPETAPALKGCITRYASPSDFDVNGKRVILDSNAMVLIEQPTGSAGTGLSSSSVTAANLHLGVPVEVYGKEDKKTHEVQTWQIRVEQRTPEVAGLGVIEALIPSSASSSSSVTLRADGYIIRITQDTKTTFTDPLKAIGDVQPNTVIKYVGTQQKDGTVLAKEATLYKNKVSDSLKKKREDWDYNPGDVPDNSRQSKWSKGFRGIDPTLFPLHKDSAVQERVSSIGAKLIPAFQKSLSASDDTRINFRFYVVDMKASDAFRLPSGIILIPYELIERLENDSQLASIIADKLAALIEQQTVVLPLTNKQLVVSYGALAAASTTPFLVPYSAYEVPSWISSKDRARREREQRDRVSLSLMHEGGFELQEAPKAWWLLSSRKPKSLAETKPPESSIYMYEILGRVWAQPQP